jgi:hypothetical protein
MCDIHFCVPSYPLEFFLPDVINNRLTFSLTSKLPVFFVQASRILLANQGRSGFNANTSQAQAHKKVCDTTIDQDNNFKDDIYCNPPQLVQLPFVCEERIVEWEIQGSKNENVGTIPDGNNVDHQQFYFVLYVKLRKLKVKKRTAGTFRIIDPIAPAPANNNAPNP